MSVKVIFMGRPTKDPVMSQSQNGTEYISLDVAVSQRGQTGNDETVFYQCYFSKGLADRLVKAKVKKAPAFPSSVRLNYTRSCTSRVIMPESPASTQMYGF